MYRREDRELESHKFSISMMIFTSWVPKERSESKDSVVNQTTIDIITDDLNSQSNLTLSIQTCKKSPTISLTNLRKFIVETGIYQDNTVIVCNRNFSLQMLQRLIREIYTTNVSQCGRSSLDRIHSPRGVYWAQRYPFGDIVPVGSGTVGSKGFADRPRPVRIPEIHTRTIIKKR